LYGMVINKSYSNEHQQSVDCQEKEQDMSQDLKSLQN
jgi:hypothetical protein